MTIRKAVLRDLDALADIEKRSYPPAEGASREQLRLRLEVFPQDFRVLEENGMILGFISGMHSAQSDLSDEMYENTSLYCPEGEWFMIFSVVSHPDFRHQKAASRLMEQLIQDLKEEGLQGIVLTCKEHLIPFYARFGYADEGISSSVHGNVQWHQMRLLFRSSNA